MNKYGLIASLLLAPAVFAADEPAVRAAEEIGNRIESVAVATGTDGTCTLEIHFDTRLLKGDRVTTAFAHLTNDAPIGCALDLTELTECGYAVTLTNHLADPSSWTQESSELYSIITSLEQSGVVLHSVTQHVGFRSVEFRDGAGLFINDQRVFLKGCIYAPTTDDLDAASAAKLIRQDLQLMKRMNMNAVRIAQSAPPEVLLDLCDSIGLYVVCDEPCRGTHPSAISLPTDIPPMVDPASLIALSDACAGTKTFIATPVSVSELDVAWNALRGSKAGVGAFIGRFADDEKFTDGLVGKNRERKAGFQAVREIWCPIQLTDAVLPAKFGGLVRIENHHDFTDISNVTFTCSYLRLPPPSSRAKLETLAQYTNAVGLPPHAGGEFQIPRRSEVPGADALRIVAKDDRGHSIGNWTRQLASVHDLNPLPAERKDVVAELKDEDGFFRTSVGPIEYRVRQTDGMLDSIRSGGAEIKFADVGLIAAPAGKLTNIITNVFIDRTLVEASYDAPLSKLKWTPLPDGWIQLTYEITGPAIGSALSLGYPATNVNAIRWLGSGPHPAAKTSVRGSTLGVWTNSFTAASDRFGPFIWARFETKDGILTIANQAGETFVSPGLSPDGSITLVTSAPTDQPATLAGPQRGSILLRFEPISVEAEEKKK